MLNKHHPRPIPFPKVRRHPKTSFFDQVSRWTIRTAFRALLDQQRSCRAKGLRFMLPSQSVLEDAMIRAIYSKLGYTPMSKHTLADHAAIERVVCGPKGAAAFVLGKFDHGYLDRSAAMGRKATHHRRFTPSMLTPRDAEKKWKVSKSLEAARLGASTATVAILRRVKIMRDDALTAKPVHVPAEAPHGVGRVASEPSTGSGGVVTVAEGLALIQTGINTNSPDLIDRGFQLLHDLCTN